MRKETIYLDGVVLRALDIDKTRDFYRSLLKAEFKLEQHGGQTHYAGRDEQRILFEIYPTKRAVTPPSPDLTFRVLRKDLIKERIQDYLEECKIDLKKNGDRWEFPDPNQRTIAITEDISLDDYIILDTVRLHCYSLDSAKDFYGHLLHMKAKENKESDSKYYIFPLPKVKLELYPAPQTVVPAPPTLIFHTSNLDYVAQRMKGKIKEIRELPHTREAMIHDLEGRKIHIYETLQEPSWLDKIYQRFVGKRQQ